MVAITPYITFKNTKEALAYYEEAFGATNVQRMPVTPDQVESFSKYGVGLTAENADDFTMHSQFEVLGQRLMASDNFMAKPLSYEAMTLNLEAVETDTEGAAQVEDLWNKVVASGATVNMPFGPQFWGGKMGDLTDKYGLRWMFHVVPAGM